MNDKKLENKKSPSSIFNFKPNISKNTEDIEVGGDSSNTLTHIYQTIQKTLLLTKQPSIQELNEKDNDNKYKEIPKKGRVSFKEPFTNIVEVESLKEFNPMMGHRGCRLAITYPEIVKMQTRAVIEAAIEVNREGMNVVPEIMIPLVAEVKELKYVREIVCETADAIIKEQGVRLDYKVGTMIEIPRAALTADKIAEEAEFFSFGTNDLTQMTYGFSRDDATKFLPYYYEKQILESDPFARLDQTGVGQLVEMATRKGRSTRSDIKLGICGEHGGDPSSVEFCHKLGLNYVSCSPFRVPLARLAAAQASIRENVNK